MPGQHSTGEDPSPDGVVLLVGIGADVPVVSPDMQTSHIVMPSCVRLTSLTAFWPLYGSWYTKLTTDQ